MQQLKLEIETEPKKSANGKWDDTITFGMFTNVLEQYRAGEIGPADAWWMLGFDGPGLPETTEYLLTKKKAHIWNGHDTECHMYLSGGLGTMEKIISPDPCGKPVCQLCAAKAGV
jgi:hypothetical protein